MLLLRIGPQVYGVGLFTVDVPRQLGRGEAVAGDARYVDLVPDIVPGLTPANLRPIVG